MGLGEGGFGCFEIVGHGCLFLRSSRNASADQRAQFLFEECSARFDKRLECGEGEVSPRWYQKILGFRSVLPGKPLLERLVLLGFVLG